jgi:hypothetical protein
MMGGEKERNDKYTERNATKKRQLEGWKKQVGRECGQVGSLLTKFSCREKKRDNERPSHFFLSKQHLMVLYILPGQLPPPPLSFSRSFSLSLSLFLFLHSSFLVFSFRAAGLNHSIKREKE